MHPAFSVIFLTTLIGAGQGLFLALYTEHVYATFNVVTYEVINIFTATGSFVALLLCLGGLLASFFHLGRPMRAWRSAAMWRTSWLSREVIVLPVFMFVLFLYGVTVFMEWSPVLFTVGTIPVTLTLLIGLVGTLLAFALYACTGMIYACLKFLQEWHSPLTLVNYTLQGMASGFTLATVGAAFMAQELTMFFGIWAVILTLVALVFRVASLVRNSRLKPKATVQSAIGVKHPEVRQKDHGFQGGSFNTREFFHHAKPAMFKSIKWFFLLMAFIIPVGLLAAGLTLYSPELLVVAFFAQYLGLIAERWFFFAQANHPQNLYYQLVSQ
jgi:DMSO reductase anchor subunit